MSIAAIEKIRREYMADGTPGSQDAEVKPAEGKKFFMRPPNMPQAEWDRRWDQAFPKPAFASEPEKPPISEENQFAKQFGEGEEAIPGASVAKEPTHEEVELAAYLDWANDGKPPGNDGKDYYYKALNRLKAERTRPPTISEAPSESQTTTEIKPEEAKTDAKTAWENAAKFGTVVEKGNALTGEVTWMDPSRMKVIETKDVLKEIAEGKSTEPEAKQQPPKVIPTPTPTPAPAPIEAPEELIRRKEIEEVQLGQTAPLPKNEEKEITGEIAAEKVAEDEAKKTAEEAETTENNAAGQETEAGRAEESLIQAEKELAEKIAGARGPRGEALTGGEKRALARDFYLAKLGGYSIQHEPGFKGEFDRFFALWPGKEKVRIANQEGVLKKDGKPLEFRVNWMFQHPDQELVDFLKSEFENKIRGKKEEVIPPAEEKPAARPLPTADTKTEIPTSPPVTETLKSAVSTEEPGGKLVEAWESYENLLNKDETYTSAVNVELETLRSYQKALGESRFPEDTVAFATGPGKKLYDEWQAANDDTEKAEKAFREGPGKKLYDEWHALDDDVGKAAEALQQAKANLLSTPGAEESLAADVSTQTAAGEEKKEPTAEPVVTPAEKIPTEPSPALKDQKVSLKISRKTGREAKLAEKQIKRDNKNTARQEAIEVAKARRAEAQARKETERQVKKQERKAAEVVTEPAKVPEVQLKIDKETGRQAKQQVDQILNQARSLFSGGKSEKADAENLLAEYGYTPEEIENYQRSWNKELGKEQKRLNIEEARKARETARQEAIEVAKTRRAEAQTKKEAKRLAKEQAKADAEAKAIDLQMKQAEEGIKAGVFPPRFALRSFKEYLRNHGVNEEEIKKMVPRDVIRKAIEIHNQGKGETEEPPEAGVPTTPSETPPTAEKLDVTVPTEKPGRELTEAVKAGLKALREAKAAAKEQSKKDAAEVRQRTKQETIEAKKIKREAKLAEKQTKRDNKNTARQEAIEVAKTRRAEEQAKREAEQTPKEQAKAEAARVKKINLEAKLAEKQTKRDNKNTARQGANETRTARRAEAQARKEAEMRAKEQAKADTLAKERTKRENKEIARQEANEARIAYRIEEVEKSIKEKKLNPPRYALPFFRNYLKDRGFDKNEIKKMKPMDVVNKVIEIYNKGKGATTEPLEAAVPAQTAAKTSPLSSAEQADSLVNATPEQLDQMINGLSPEGKQRYEQQAEEILTKATLEGKTEDEQTALLLEHQRNFLRQV